MTAAVIGTQGLVKKFGAFTAVDGIDLTVRPGEIYGFLGPNAAGKTTTLLMLLGIVKPTSGTIKIFGEDATRFRPHIRERIGVVAESGRFYDEMTALEYVRFFGKLYGVEDIDKRAAALMERLDLWQWRDALIDGFSTGMRRKLGFVRAILHSPDLLILDEPVAGLDPYGIIQVRELLMDVNRAGTTILISSHILSEVENTADRVGIIANGKLIAEDAMPNLQQRVSGQHEIEVELMEVGAELVAELEALPFINEIRQQGNLLLIYTANDRDYREELGRVFSEKQAIVTGMRVMRATLEETFVMITEAHVRKWAADRKLAEVV